MYIIIINPNAERGQSILRLPMLTALFDAVGLEYETHITTKTMDGYHATLKLLKRWPQCKGIIGMGGDGIMQEIVAGMVDAFPESSQGQRIPIPLGILPSASGNDFMSTLEGDKSKAHAKYRKEPETVVKNFFDTLMRGRIRTIDVITAGGMGFINIGHVGLDVQIALNAAKLKSQYDEYAYWVSGFKSVLSHGNIPLVIETPEARQEGKYVFVTVCNGQYYGGGMRIAPHARIDDGKITSCILRPMSRLRTLSALSKLLGEKHERLKNLSFVSCDELKLIMPPTLLCLDGNFYEREGETIFRVLPLVLDLFV